MTPLAYTDSQHENLQAGPEKSSRKIFTKGKKKGQFYLLSAIIIISIIIGFSTISTYTRKGGDVRIFDLGEELSIESANVLDYGTYPANQEDIASEGGLNDFIEGFVDDYADYIGEDKEISFVFGNKNDVNVVNYEEEERGSASYGSSKISIGRRERSESGPGEIKVTNNKATITFKDKDYDIELKPGENFFFVISQDIGEEVHIAKSKDIE